MLLSSLMICSTASAASSGSLKRNVYYANGMSATELASIDADKYKITHICYAFVSASTHGYISSEKSNDVVLEPENGKTYRIDSSTAKKLDALKQLKQKYSWLKVLISVGGGSQTQDDNFRAFISNSTYRTNFAKGCADLVKDYGFDGIDLDWEHPDTAAESADYTALCKLLRNSSYLGAKGNGKLLTIAFPVSSSYVKKIIANDISALNGYLDFWNLMTYDLGDGHSFEFIAPLNYKSGTESYGFTSVSDGVAYYHDAGVAYADMNMGVPFYGKLITNFSTTGNITFGAESSSIKYEKPSYKTIVSTYLGKSGWMEKWCEGAKCPYLLYTTSSSSTSDSKKVITKALLYDNPKSLGYKIDYAKSLGIGGMMVWAYASDDTSNSLKTKLAEGINFSKETEIPVNPTEDKEETETTEPETPTPAEPQETSEGVALSQNFDKAPAISATAKDSTPGTWSVSNSNGSNHAALSVYASSSGETSLKVKITDGRWNLSTYCGYNGADSTSKLTFKVWVPSGSTINRISSITAGSNTVLGETPLTANAWNYITTGTFGSAQSGVVKITFNSSAAAVGQSIYIDNFVISKEVKEVEKVEYVLNQDFSTMPATSSTAGNTTNGTWSTAKSSSTGNHVTFSQTSVSSEKVLKAAVTNGRYTIDTYCGFQGAKTNSKLSFKVWIPEKSTVNKIKFIKIGSTVILGETALKTGAWNQIETAAFGGVTGGAVQIEFYSGSAANSQYFYIDDFVISKP